MSLIREPDWTIIQANKEARELALRLIAVGMFDHDIAIQINKGNISVTVDDVKAFRQHNTGEIVAYQRKHAQEILGMSVRSHKTFRIGELNQLAELLISNIPTMLAEKPSLAAQIGKLYLQVLQQIVAETGDLVGPADTKNIWVEALKKAGKQDQILMMKLLAELDELTRKLDQGEATNAALVIDAEFTAGDGK